MMNILEELWYGNICPSEQPIRKSSEYARILRKVETERDKLNSQPAQIQREIDRLLDTQMEAAAVGERDAFIMGFRLAAQIMADSLLKTDRWGAMT